MAQRELHSFPPNVTREEVNELCKLSKTRRKLIYRRYQSEFASLPVEAISDAIADEQSRPNPRLGRIGFLKKLEYERINGPMPLTNFYRGYMPRPGDAQRRKASPPTYQSDKVKQPRREERVLLRCRSETVGPSKPDPPPKPKVTEAVVMYPLAHLSKNSYSGVNPYVAAKDKPHSQTSLGFSSRYSQPSSQSCSSKTTAYPSDSTISYPILNSSSASNYPDSFNSSTSSYSYNYSNLNTKSPPQSSNNLISYPNIPAYISYPTKTTTNTCERSSKLDSSQITNEVWRHEGPSVSDMV